MYVVMDRMWGFFWGDLKGEIFLQLQTCFSSGGQTSEGSAMGFEPQGSHKDTNSPDVNKSFWEEAEVFNKNNSH